MPSFSNPAALSPQVNDSTTFAALQEKVAQSLTDLNVEKDAICADWANQRATARLQVGWASFSNHEKKLT
jgi:hypothetical protein